MSYRFYSIEAQNNFQQSETDQLCDFIRLEDIMTTLTHTP